MMMLAPHFAKSVQYFGRTCDACCGDSKARCVAVGVARSASVEGGQLSRGVERFRGFMVK